MPLQATILVVGLHVWEPVRRFKPKLFENFDTDSPSGYSNHFMRLDAQSPLRVIQAIAQGALCILSSLRSVHRLEHEMVEMHVFKTIRHELGLWVDQLSS